METVLNKRLTFREALHAAFGFRTDYDEIVTTKKVMKRIVKNTKKQKKYAFLYQHKILNKHLYKSFTGFSFCLCVKHGIIYLFFQHS